MAALVALLLLLVALVQVGALGYAYGRLGISATTAFALLAMELLGSALNIRVGWVRSPSTVTFRRVVVFGVAYLVPLASRPQQTLVAVNVGGALLPVGICIYVLAHGAAWTPTLAATALVTVGVKLVARPVPGVGVVVPALCPALMAAVAAVAIAARQDAAVVAFVSGTVGTLVGADLMNLHRIADLGAPVVSIGGAGTFDGIFVTGIAAVVLVSISL